MSAAVGNMLASSYHAGADMVASEVNGTATRAATSSTLTDLIASLPDRLSAQYASLGEDLLNRLDDGFTASVEAANWEAAQAGKAETYQANDIANVRITASPGACAFCQGYDGRILPPDSPGIPPLHNGCDCDQETLPPPEPQESS